MVDLYNGYLEEGDYIYLGDVPLSTEDAEQILDVLEMYAFVSYCWHKTNIRNLYRVDTQGLLDRIFPLPTEHTSTLETEAGPSTGTQSYSFRALLKSPANYPLRVLRVRTTSSALVPY